MVEKILAKTLRKMLAETDVTVVDVRDTEEFAEGHIHGALHIPLALVKESPLEIPLMTPVVFVCARGIRSNQAALVVEPFTTQKIISLDGGMQAWQLAGLPMQQGEENVITHSLTIKGIKAENVVKPNLQTTWISHQQVSQGNDCSIPAPSIENAVALNVKTMRTRAGLSLDELAARAQMSRTTIGQIELGRSTATVPTLWKLARAFDVPFSALLQMPQKQETIVMRKAQSTTMQGSDGRFTSRALFPPGQQGAEMYELWYAPFCQEEAEPHPQGTRENIVVTSGQLNIEVAGYTHHLKEGDAIVFDADKKHTYRNPLNVECKAYLVMFYSLSRP